MIQFDCYMHWPWFSGSVQQPRLRTSRNYFEPPSYFKERFKSVIKVMVCFRNNITPFLTNKKCFRSELRFIFESHWRNEFFNKTVYFKSNTVVEIEINWVYFMTLQCDCNLTQGISIFTPIYIDNLWNFIHSNFTIKNFDWITLNVIQVNCFCFLTTFPLFWFS